MLKYTDLVSNIKDDTKIEEYLLDFFCKKNYKDYEPIEKPSRFQKMAIKTMFESKKGLLDRVDTAFIFDPFCIEALFVYLMMSEDVFIQLRFNKYYEELNKYPSLDTYQKACYLKMLDLYVDFLLDINNITKAIEIEKLIIKLTNKYSAKSVSRLAYCYYSIENADDFYRLYAEADFTAYEYLLLLVTLLIHEEDLKAQEVLLDMYSNIEYSTYLDHVWDLDENDPKQKDFVNVINDCFDDIKCVPTFFSWVNKTREKYGK